MIIGQEGQGTESVQTGGESAATGGQEVPSGADAPAVGDAAAVADAAQPVIPDRRGAKGGFKPPVAAAGLSAEKPLVPPYQANYKFKVLDKEHEFDEFVRGAIKDADTEKKVRELYEKAFGLDSVKQDRQTLKGELAQAKEKMAETDTALESLGQFVRQGDYDSFFEALSIPQDQILKYALQLVQRQQWTPDQKAQWEASRNAQAAARYYQGQNEQLTQSQRQLSVQQRDFELSTVVSRPDIQQVAQAYEAGMGTPGAFRDYVVRIGQAYAAQGQDISAEQAVTEAVRHLRAVNPQLGQTQQQMAPAAPQVVQPHQKPVIPNIQGRGTSPVRSTVKSLDDLKKRARELEAQGA